MGTEPKHDDVDWKTARRLYESDAESSFATIGKLLGCSKQRVWRRAKQEGWEKLDFEDPRLSLAVDIASDRKSADMHFEETPEIDPANDVVQPRQQQPRRLESNEPKSLDRRTVEMAVDMRSEVVDRHRREWNVVRNMTYKGVNAPPSEQEQKLEMSFLAAKIFEKIQNGERKAWKLEAAPIQVTKNAKDFWE